MSVDYKELVAKAEKAVASVSDPSLKQIAFQKVLDDLLGRHSDQRAEGSSRSDASGGAKKAKPKLKAKAKAKRSGPAADVEELVDEGFFKERQPAEGVIAELANRGRHIKGADARVILLRLCQARLLRRKKEGKVYLYSNW